jgi:hypothetical protein
MRYYVTSGSKLSKLYTLLPRPQMNLVVIAFAGLFYEVLVMGAALRARHD